jgi:hypothetical protein
MAWAIAVLCALALFVIFATAKKGTISIVLGLVMMSGVIDAVGRGASVESILYGLTFSTVVLLWGLSYKLEARFPVPAKRERQPTP